MFVQIRFDTLGYVGICWDVLHFDLLGWVLTRQDFLIQNILLNECLISVFGCDLLCYVQVSWGLVNSVLLWCVKMRLSNSIITYFLFRFVSLGWVMLVWDTFSFVKIRIF